MKNKRTLTKELIPKFFKSEKKKIITVSTHEPIYKLNKKGERTHCVTLGTMLNGVKYHELQKFLQDRFYQASCELNCRIDELYFHASNSYARIAHDRLETDDEYTERIHGMARDEADRIIENRKYENKLNEHKRKQIEKLEQEIERLKNS